MPAPVTTRSRGPQAQGWQSPKPIARLTQRMREGLVFAVVATGALAVLVMWSRDTPASSLNGLGSELIAAGRITALLGTYLVVVEVALMGRIPWLDRLIGMDRLAVWHRRNGQYVIWLLVAHTLLTIWGYAISDHTGLGHEAGVMLLSYPDVLAATAALGMLVTVGIVSARAARRRLRFETWYFIHLYTYLAIALSFAHQFSTGNDFITHPLNRVLWVGLYVVAFGLLGTYRVAIPIRNALRHRLRVVNVVNEAPGVVSIYIGGDRLEELRAEPGQFFLWRFWTRHGWWQAHPFSLSAAPNPNWLRIMVKASGDHTRDLQEIHVGTRVFAEGPYGAFTAARRSLRRVLLIGAGAGIAPLRCLLETLPASPGDITLLYRARSEQDLALRAEIDELARLRGARVHYLLGPRRKRANSFHPATLQSLVPKLASHDVYVCGPTDMRAQAVAGLREAGVPRRNIHMEDFHL